MDDAPRPEGLWRRVTSDGLLHAVVADVGESLDLWSVDLWAFSGDADTLECRAYWCRDQAAALVGDCMGAVIGLDQSHDLRRLVLAAEVVERHLGGDLSAADTAALTQAGFTSRIDVPLLAGAEVLGVLSLAEKRAVRRLSPDERARLETLARLAGAVLRATRLYEAESDRAERLTELLVTGHGLSASLSAEEIVAGVREEAARLINGVVCAAEVVLRQDDGTFARVAPADEAGAVWRADAVARQAAELGRPEQGRTADGRARLLLPLSAEGRTTGYLELTAPLQRRFRETEVELASLLAGQAAAALEPGAFVPGAAEPVGHGHAHGALQPLVLLRAAVCRGRTRPPLPAAADAGGRRAGPRGGACPDARPRVPRRRAGRHGPSAADQPARQGGYRLPPRRRPVRAPAARTRCPVPPPPASSPSGSGSGWPRPGSRTTNWASSAGSP